VDASVGGKTAVDHPTGKNLIGAFYQPGGVLIDVETLRTLPATELRGGLAECVKHGVIRDAGLLELLESSAEAILACDAETMTDLVARNVGIKAAVVAADEREAGEREHLNFGHTVGHGIEAAGGYGGLSHGEAVSLGMVAECGIASERGLLAAADAARVRHLLERLGLPVRRPGLDADEVWHIMQHDKKARRGRVRVVLPTGLGRVDVYDDVTADEVARAVASLA
jgi:3-dehydroquinate synthase